MRNQLSAVLAFLALCCFVIANFIPELEEKIFPDDNPYAKPSRLARMGLLFGLVAAVLIEDSEEE